MSYDPFVLPVELAGVQPISGIITTAMADEANAHTLQALIEVSYVRTGNQILSDGLGELEEALDITQTSLDTLATLQQLHNSVTVSSLSAFDFDFETKLSSNGISTSVYPRGISKMGKRLLWNAHPTQLPSLKQPMSPPPTFREVPTPASVISLLNSQRLNRR